TGSSEDGWLAQAKAGDSSSTSAAMSARGPRPGRCAGRFPLLARIMSGIPLPLVPAHAIVAKTQENASSIASATFDELGDARPVLVRRVVRESVQCILNRTWAKESRS